jgi:hypothetical protein
MTAYKLNHFTIADAGPLVGKAADITEWDDDELGAKVTYPGARVIGIIDRIGPYLVIETAGAVVADAATGERLGTRPPSAELCIGFTWVCEIAGVRDPYRPGDRIALEETGDPYTRLRPGDEGTVTRFTLLRSLTYTPCEVMSRSMYDKFLPLNFCLSHSLGQDLAGAVIGLGRSTNVWPA